VSRPYSNCPDCTTPAYESDDQRPPRLHDSSSRVRALVSFDCSHCPRRWWMDKEEAELWGRFAERAKLPTPPEPVIFTADAHTARPIPKRIRSASAL
jgi:hypothetical protein